VIFTDPLPFSEALNSRLVRTLLPTDLRTDLLDTIPAALRERSVFSAGVQNANVLQQINDSVDTLLNGESSIAEQRVEMKKLLDSLGDDVDETDLTDIRSDARLNLILETQLAQAQGAGYKIQGEQPLVLNQWPAWEFVRVQDKEVPRGFRRGKGGVLVSVPEESWPARWAAAGGTFYGDRMIALKKDSVWKEISRFGVDYPPFDFNSGMDVMDVDYDTAVAAGLLEDGADVPVPDPLDFNADLQATPDVRADWLRTALAEALQGVAAFDAAGVLKVTGGAR
jgi:hypothetical protein